MVQQHVPVPFGQDGMDPPEESPTEEIGTLFGGEVLVRAFEAGFLAPTFQKEEGAPENEPYHQVERFISMRGQREPHGIEERGEQKIEDDQIRGPDRALVLQDRKPW